MTKGQIRKALSGFYYVHSEGKTYQTRARGVFRNQDITPLVGDIVEFESDNEDEGVIQEIYPRKNELRRPPVSNIDLAMVVMSLKAPDFSTQLLDRLLVQVEYARMQSIIFITKLDLGSTEEIEEINKIKKYYEEIGYPVFMTSFDDHLEDLDTQLTKIMENRTAVLMGQSGAGKSTLLNRLIEGLNLKTAETSKALGRGKHTTRHVSLIPAYSGLIADTPGFSSLDFEVMEAEELPKAFPEFLSASQECRFRGCMHKNEPDCEVKERVEDGEILESRYTNYLQFLTEIEERKPRY